MLQFYSELYSTSGAFDKANLRLISSGNYTSASLYSALLSIANNISRLDIDSAGKAGRASGELHLQYYYDYLGLTYNQSNFSSNSQNSTTTNSSQNSTTTNSSQNSTNKTRLLQYQTRLLQTSSNSILRADKQAKLFVTGYLYEISQNANYYNRYWSRGLLTLINSEVFNITKFSEDQDALSRTHFELDKPAMAQMFEVSSLMSKFLNLPVVI